MNSKSFEALHMKIEKVLEEMDLEKDELEKARYYLNLKGIELHYSILQYLSSFSASRIKYCQLATVYRYDKRIRKVLYKYIGLFEEYIRAFISNKYSDNLEKITLTTILEKSYIKERQLYKVLDKALFADLIHQVFQLSADDKAELFPNIVYDQGNLRAIIELRNAVSHNRFLLNYLDFKECNLNGDRKGSLYANLVNFSNFLTPEIRSGFITEINGCQFCESNTPNKSVHQTMWVLPSQVIIKL